MSVDIQKINDELADKHPLEIIRWAVGLDKKIVLTTNFNPQEPVILHLATQVLPDIPVLWIDHGYNTNATYQVAKRLIEELKLNIKIYAPAKTRAWREAALGGIPEIDTPEHDAFTREVKLEPFERAMREANPEVWLTAIRADQTEFRKGLDIVTQGNDGVLKVAPVYHWTKEQMEEYMLENKLPIEEDYNDPTKVQGNRECGLHTSTSTVVQGEGDGI